MDRPFPIRLADDPIVESLFEIRFSAESGTASDLLPGLFYPALKSEYSQVRDLDVRKLPSEIRRKDPNLKYAPTVRFESNQFAIMLGDAVCSLSCRKPYVGWENFHGKIDELIGLLLDSGIVNAIERYSLKYVNLIEDFDSAHGLEVLDASLKLGPYDLNSPGCTIRTEIIEDGIINLIQVISSANAIIPEIAKPLSGLLLDIDSIKQYKSPVNTEDFSRDFPEGLNVLRNKEREVFFSLLAQETVNHYGPQYAKEPNQ